MTHPAARARAEIAKNPAEATDKTDERGVSSVSSVPVERVIASEAGLSSVSSVGHWDVFALLIVLKLVPVAPSRASDDSNMTPAQGGARRRESRTHGESRRKPNVLSRRIALTGAGS